MEARQKTTFLGQKMVREEKWQEEKRKREKENGKKPVWLSVLNALLGRNPGRLLVLDALHDREPVL